MISFSLLYSIHKNIRSYFNMSHTKKTKEHKANQQWTEKMLMLLLADSLIILISYFTKLCFISLKFHIPQDQFAKYKIRINIDLYKCLFY